jgi:hypothetical protein
VCFSRFHIVRASQVHKEPLNYPIVPCMTPLLHRLFFLAIPCDALDCSLDSKRMAQVHKRRHELLNYLIFLRVTPLLPNTFISVASPIVNVPLPLFFLGTLIGCSPSNFVMANAGARASAE